MRRTFLFQLIAGCFAVKASEIQLKASESPQDQGSIEGQWHLLGTGDDEVRVPQHRMDLRFKNSSGELKGAVLSRNDGSEMPLASTALDGSMLRFQMAAPSGKAQTGMPTMVMTKHGDRFEGAWTNSAGEKMGPPLKLVRYR